MWERKLLKLKLYQENEAIVMSMKMKKAKKRRSRIGDKDAL